MITGRCLCASVRYRIREAPLALYYCHCEQCRRASGSAFAANLLVPSEGFELTSGEEALTSFESSPGKRRHFCSRCGSPIFSAAEATPQLRSVRCGSVDGDPGQRSTGHFFVASKAPWFEICDELPRQPAGLGTPRAAGRR